MRITNRMLHETALRNLTANAGAMAQVQERISTTRQLVRPSDDPARVREAVKLHDTLAAIDQYVRNIDVASRTVGAAEDALGSAGEAIQRARELAVQGATDSLSTADRASIAIEVNQLLDQVLAASRARLGDSHVFSGHRTDLPPFAIATGAYQGDAGAILARIGPGTTMPVNVTGDAAFGPALAAIEQLRAELAAGTRVSGGTISALDAAQGAALDARAVLGVRQAGLDATRDTLDRDALAARALLSELEDVDLVAAISELSERQATYEAALRVTGLILRTSLVDELR